ncbi:MAG TPA: HypC/HybG/HupF family hydrogenase formation chaperone [Ramlibacter sp.]|uniref:HypC/HybG/HupF family hydrogenase formation chaperone n=1 Tax=Ramlibacter sp. TaxID=1917967 RepID=UPI002D7F26F6|nr:HypC/HybG/HupF family hydrogenase formation chaperone [Ramlibacter sp.]HET8746363.1 HypC/HybG/HupF family hydrogenase formation chaperone [Ramlibacter sp.]
MCLAAPSRVVALAEGEATVECFGQRREVSLLLLDEPVAVGDYLLVQAGGFAFERMDAAAGEAALEAMLKLLAQDDAVSARRWGSA